MKSYLENLINYLIKLYLPKERFVLLLREKNQQWRHVLDFRLY